MSSIDKAGLFFPSGSARSWSQGGPDRPDPLLPRALRPGDTVAIAAPAGPVSEDALLRGLRILEGRYRVVYGAGILAQNGYLAGDDQRRAGELLGHLRDPRVRAVFCARGGYGSLRLISRLEPLAVRADPKPLVGFSDITVLLAWAHAAGVRAVHGPVVAQLGQGLEAGDEARLLALLEDPAPPPPLHSAVPAVTGGRTSGRLLGGNLELLTRLLGSPLFPDLAGAVLFFEEVGEKPYRIDRALTQLELAGVLDDLAAVVVGELGDCADPRFPRPCAEDVVAERLSRLGVPLLLGLPLGHGRRNAAVPYGGVVTVDADAGVLEFHEGAVASR